MSDEKLLEHYKKLEELMGGCYEKYKHLMNEEEKDCIEEYLYTQGEYEEAWGNLKAILGGYKVDDKECLEKLEEAKKLMGLNDRN